MLRMTQSVNHLTTARIYHSCRVYPVRKQTLPFLASVALGGLPRRAIHLPLRIHRGGDESD